MPATTNGEQILAHKPDGVFLSNGPGDPAATGEYAIPAIQTLLAAGVPVFGICLGHQMLALALGAKTRKMLFGHRGANHPVKDLKTGKVEITCQNHGFEVVMESLPKGVTAAAATIAADKTEVEIVLSAAQDAQQGGVKNLVVKGTTTVGKVKHAADSAAVAVTVE